MRKGTVFSSGRMIARRRPWGCCMPKAFFIVWGNRRETSNGVYNVLGIVWDLTHEGKEVNSWTGS